MMPSGQFYTVVISVSDILPLDKGHYISVYALRKYLSELFSERIHSKVSDHGYSSPFLIIRDY